MAGLAIETTTIGAHASTLYIFRGATAIARRSSKLLSLAYRLVVFPVSALALGAAIRHRFAALAVHQGTHLAARFAGQESVMVWLWLRACWKERGRPSWRRFIFKQQQCEAILGSTRINCDGCFPSER
jgi:hypothetical protein